MGRVMDGVGVREMERGGAGVVCCLCLYFWGSWDGFFIRRIRLHRLGDRFLDGREGFGEVDGAAVDLVVVILGILRLRIQGRDIILGSRRGGDQGFGLELWAELPRDIWLGTEETDKSPHHKGAILGLVGIVVPITLLLDGVIRVLALLQDMRAQGLDRRHEGRQPIGGIHGILALQTLYPMIWAIPKGIDSVNTFRGVDDGKKKLCTEGRISSPMSCAKARSQALSILCNHTRPKCGLVKRRSVKSYSKQIK
jgi:hypothetical protein